MHPQVGYRVISTAHDIIFEKKHKQSYSRFCIPNINQGFVNYIRQFCNFYKCNFSKNTFKEQVKIYKSEAIGLFEQNFNNTITNKAYLHRKIRLCEIGLAEDWHSPVFVIKSSNKIIATTGHNKIYATAIRKKNFNLDFSCFVFDFDKTQTSKFINIKEINTDNDFANEIGSNDFAIDISIEKTIAGFVPAVMQFSKHYPINYHDGSHELSNINQMFFNKYKTNNALLINIDDQYNSSITTTTDVFKKTTNRQINFDLSDLLPFLALGTTLYISQDQSYYLKVKSNSQKEKIVGPSNLL